MTKYDDGPSEYSLHEEAEKIIRAEVLDAAYEFGRRPGSRGDRSPLGRLRGACIRYFEFYASKKRKAR